MTNSSTQTPSERLQQIAASGDMMRDEKLNAILELGLSTFYMQNAIISHIDYDARIYTVRYALSPDNVIVPGTVFDLGNTYCNMTIDVPSAVMIPHVAISEHKRHPCYQQFKLESYIGHRVMVNGRNYGTINFSSLSARALFMKEESVFIQQMGDAVGRLLEQK
ncbi:MAG: GAF domain-containing protein [Chloroflexota bacterium]